MFYSSQDKSGIQIIFDGFHCNYCNKQLGGIGEICRDCANIPCENCGEVRAHHSYGSCPLCKSCNHSLDIHDRSTGYCSECGCSAAYSKEASKHQQRRGQGSNKTQAGNPNFGGFAGQTSGSYNIGSDVFIERDAKNSGRKTGGPPAMPGMKATSSKSPQNSQLAKGKKSGGPPPMPKFKDKSGKSTDQKSGGKSVRSKPPEMPGFDTRTHTPSEKVGWPEKVEEILSPIPEWRNLPWFKNKSDKDGGLNGADPKETNMIYVNGVLTDIETHRRTLAELSEKLGGVPIAGIYNNTENIKDAWQTFNDRLQAMGGWERLDGKNKAVEQLITQIKEKNGKIEIYAHSQGGAIVAAALNELYRNSALDMRNIQVTTFGSFGKEWPEGPKYHHYVHYSDIVPYAGELIGGGQGVTKGISDWIDGNSPPGTTVLWDNKSGMDAAVNPIATHSVSDYISEIDEFKKSEALKNRG